MDCKRFYLINSYMSKYITSNQLSGIHIFMVRTIKINSRLNAGHHITVYKYITDGSSLLQKGQSLQCLHVSV